MPPTKSRNDNLLTICLESIILNMENDPVGGFPSLNFILPSRLQTWLRTCEVTFLVQ